MAKFACHRANMRVAKYKDKTHLLQLLCRQINKVILIAHFVCMNHFDLFAGATGSGLFGKLF